MFRLRRMGIDTQSEHVVFVDEGSVHDGALGLKPMDRVRVRGVREGDAREITGVRVISTLSALELLGRSARGVAALNEVRAERSAPLNLPWAVCAFRATRDPAALALLREVFLDAKFCGGREGWLVDSAFQVLADEPAAVRAAAPELVSLVERMDRHHLAVRALQLLRSLAEDAAPWLPRLRAAVEGVEEDDLRADLLELLEQIPLG